MKFAVPLACVSLFAVAACATSPETSPVALDALLTDSQADPSAYGLFLSGSAAVQDGDNAAATRYFTEAARVSGSPEVREEAFFTSVLAGDIQGAAKLAPATGSGSPGAVRLGRLVKAVDAMAQNDGKDAFAALSGEPVGYPHRAAGALLKPWAAAAAGDWAAATAEPELKSDRLAFNLGSLAQAQLLEKSRRYAEAEATLKTMSAQSDTGGVFMEAYGAFLERRGRQAEAVAVYDAALAKTPTDRSTQAARERAAARKAPPPLPEPRIGAANALLGAAAGAMLLKQSDLSLIYLRLALRLDPKGDEAWMLLGDTLNVAGDADGARAAYDKVSPKSPGYVEARSRVIWTFQGAGESETALKMAQETVRLAPGNALAQTTLADVLRANKLYAESAQVLDGVIATAGEKADWRLYYLRALARDKAGRWADAESDLQAGLKLKPDEAELLNYLGYSWIDRGERLDQALDMIKRALVSEPDSGAIVDSLGWAYYRLGQFDKAVEQLERAAQLEPIDAEINNHLGDAYWRVGRRIEAEFQWRKVLTTMSPPDELKAQLEAKLKTGLQPVAPAKVATR
jgi:tetratricopeptide (TPR) repeat protein